MKTKLLSILAATLVVPLSPIFARSPISAKLSDTFQPYLAGEVPQTVEALWKDYDPSRAPLEIKVIKEWKAEGVITRYVTFKIGRFKGADARLAAYYSFPDNGDKNLPAFVWSHGGGQRAERGRGIYFAKQGYATVDINWLGRQLEDDIEENTDWGKVDPTQGPRFYPKALREHWKLNLQPDEHTIDEVPSPRNCNWFLLAVAARRAITFLEQQPEVDPERIGFSGYSMGGMITALSAIDPRLKAVAPFVGGTGFKYVDIPGGIEGSSLRHQLRHLELYRKTIDASSYWPLVRCPVMFISSSNDFHAVFERIYQSMDLLPHKNWRVSTNIHQNHGPGPEQWVLLIQWFDQYLKGIDQNIPATPPSTFKVDKGQATFTVTPEQPERLIDTEIYYSYDPNGRTRFWIRADAESSGATYSVTMPVHSDLPLYVHALCRYKLDKPQLLERGETSTMVLNSIEHSIVPDAVNIQSLKKLANSSVVDDFANGTRDWSSRDGRTIKTYKFQDPFLDRSGSRKLAVTIDPQGKQLALRINIDSKFLDRKNNIGAFTYTTRLDGTELRKILIDRTEFESADGKSLEWSKIATFEITIIDQETKQKLELTSQEEPRTLQRIELVK